MNAKLGWLLVVVGLVAGWKAYGWQGVVMAASVTVFWLLLQFSRAMRAMKTAGESPMGRLDSAVMFNARLKPGLTLMQVVGMTRSLGQAVVDPGETPSPALERWRWTDEGGSSVLLAFSHGKLQRWTLERPPEAAAAAPADAPATAMAAEPPPPAPASAPPAP